MKKKRSSGDLLNEDKMTPPLEEVSHEIRKKKKKNRNVESVITTTVEEISHENRKKKKKTKNIESEMTPPEEVSHEVRKKKKKTKKVESESGGPSNTKLSIRQMKREKHAQRQAEAEAAVNEAVQKQALSYLSLWKHNKAEWKFNKIKQTWLYKHKFDSQKVPDELWDTFVEYFVGAMGGVKVLLINDSKKVINEMEVWVEKNSENENATDKPSEIAYQRARQLLQHISE